MKRLLVISDSHCGHGLGLTPPEFESETFKDISRVGWEFFSKTVKELKPDYLLINGDAVDGTGHKDTSQHLTTDMEKQVEIAIRCIEEVEAEKILFTRGTPYHVKDNMDHENYIAKYFDAEIKDSLKFDINGLILHARHTTGKGGTAYASVTSLQRSAVVGLLDDIVEEKQKADIYIRSHIHEYNCLRRSLMTCISTPCLQFRGTSYGRKCTGFYDYGILYIDIEDKNNFNIYERLLNVTNGKTEEVIKL